MNLFGISNSSSEVGHSWGMLNRARGRCGLGTGAGVGAAPTAGLGGSGGGS